MNVIDQEHLQGDVVLSPFLPGTKIQYEEAYKIVEGLLEKAIYDAGCLLCHLAPYPKGCSYIGLGGRNGIKVRAPRLVLSVIKCRWLNPDELALHECDRPRCINPVHLFEGTFEDNTQDMMIKGRWSNGDCLSSQIRKLETANRIKEYLIHNPTANNREVAIQLYLSESTVSNYLGKNGVYRELIFTN